jgi:2-polyprenyl-6-methoxyphenol hydroxylase-like FAD-dependent oxidoreductase
MVPQWHFLTMLADAGRAEPTFSLRMQTEVTDLLWEAGRVAGVRCRTANERTCTVSAELVVAADGRGSTVRDAAGLTARVFGVPMDIWWFRLPRRDGEPAGAFGRLSRGRILGGLDRGDYYQCGFLISHGMDTPLRTQGIEPLQQSVSELAPWLAGPLLRVAQARTCGNPPRLRQVDRAAAQVQRRRWLATAATQAAQRFAHRLILAPRLASETPRSRWTARRGRRSAPLPTWLLSAVPGLQVLPAWLVGIGLRPEHAPEFARPSVRGSRAYRSPM